MKQTILNNIDNKDFFIQKAIGWTLRDYSQASSKFVRLFVNKFKNRLSSLAQREALRKITA